LSSPVYVHCCTVDAPHVNNFTVIWTSGKAASPLCSHASFKKEASVHRRRSANTSPQFGHDVLETFQIHHKLKMWAKYSTEAKYIATWRWRQRIRQTRWDLYSNAMYRASWRQWMRAKYSTEAKYRANWCWRKRMRQTMRHTMPQKRADSSFRATERQKQQQSRHLKRVSDLVAAFSQHIQEDPVHTCVSRHRHLYRQSVVKFIETSYKPASQEILATMLARETTSCTCQRYIRQGQVPPQAAVNGLLLDDTPKLLRLTELSQH